MTVNHYKNEKVSIMMYRAMFFNILMSMLCCIYSPTIVALHKQGAMPQMQDFESELEEANRAIEEYIASLPPAEQEEFNRQVEDMAKMFENMSEEDFEKFLGEMFTDEQMMEPSPFEISEPVVQEVVEVTLSDDDKKKVETVVKVIEGVINQTNLFLVIVNTSPELPHRIDRWATKGAIANWQPATDWDKFKGELEVFVQKLYKTLEQDVNTKKYKYLSDVIADEAFYNNLIQLQTELNAFVPTINIPEFSVQKLSAQSKSALKNLLTKYTESFYLLGLPQSLDTLFAKYAPEAEKIRLAEEAANKRALEAQKSVRTPAGATSAGMEPDNGYDYGSGSPYYGGDYGSYGNDYGSYGGDYGSYGNDSSGSDRSSGGSRGDGASSGGSGTGSSGELGDKDKKGKGKKDTVKFIPNYKIERAIADIKSGLQRITAALAPDETTELPTSLADLKSTIEKSDIDVIFAGSTLPMVDKELSLIDEAIKTITNENLNATDLTHYQGEIEIAFKKNGTKLKSLRDDIDKNFELSTEEETESTKIKVAELSPEKQWAYFEQGILPTGDANDKLKEQITAPVSLFTIKDKIDTLFKDIEKLAIKRAPVVKKQPVEPVVDTDFEE